VLQDYVVVKKDTVMSLTNIVELDVNPHLVNVVSKQRQQHQLKLQLLLLNQALPLQQAPRFQLLQINVVQEWLSVLQDYVVVRKDTVVPVMLTVPLDVKVNLVNVYQLPVQVKNVVQVLPFVLQDYVVVKKDTVMSLISIVELDVNPHLVSVVSKQQQQHQLKLQLQLLNQVLPHLFQLPMLMVNVVQV